MVRRYTFPTMGFLTDTVEGVRRRLERQPIDESGLMSLAIRMPPPRGFAARLWSAKVPAVIAEVKRSSPSAGRIADADPAARARAYEEAGAAAISVLTEPVHFDGSLADLRAVHHATTIPILRKDFLVHPAQLIEARVAGADAVLLIAAVLSETELKAMLNGTEDLGLGALVEAHSAEDLGKAVDSGAKVVGVNARDLESLEVDEDRALALLRSVPDDRIAVFESGISTPGQVARAVGAGAKAVLVGEALMRAEDPGAKLRELRGTA
jgi:indole-3-glycerol phosphate synthase